VGSPFGFFIGPGIPDILAQKLRLRGPPPGWGALSFDPVARLYFARPLAVSPPFLDFSPRPSESETLFLPAIRDPPYPVFDSVQPALMLTKRLEQAHDCAAHGMDGPDN
jgi:hypothetical protein